MSPPPVRTAFAVVMIGAALMAAAASPGSAAARARSSDDFAGTWITWWDEAEGVSACSRMYVAPENDSTLDGMWAAPGWNGLLHGSVQQGRAGLVWQGQWRDANGAGGFRFVLGAPGARVNEFQGTYTTRGSGGELAWNGVREVAGEARRVPCSFQE
jgi:hypothetical protein